MKKFLFSICALFVASSTFAANTYSIDKVYLSSTGQASVAVAFSLEDGFACGGYGFTIQLPDELKFVDAKVTAGDCYADPPSITSNILPSGALKVGYSSSTVLTKQSGVLLSCKIQAKSSVSAGTVFTANLVDAMFVKAPSTSVAVADASFDIEITDKVILDETSKAMPAAQDGVNVLVKRTIKKDVWSTIVLPFAMTKAKAEAAFGEDASYAQFSGFTTTLDMDTFTPTAITINYTPYTLGGLNTLKTGTAYLIRTTKDITEFTVDGVNISTTITPVSKADTEYPDNFSGSFTGSFVKTTVPSDGLFLSGNKLYYSKGATNIKAYRGWLKLDVVLNKALDLGAPVYLNVDGETTKVEGMNISFEDGQYYNLKGQKVDNPTQKGVYIRNGKKVVIK